MPQFLFTYVAAFFFLVLNAHAETDDQLEYRKSLITLQHRVNELQQQVGVLQEFSEKSRVKTFLEDELILGGFLDTGITGIEGANTKTQFSVATNSLSLSLAADFKNGFRVNTQLLFTDDFPLLNPDDDPNGPAAGIPASRKFGPLVFSAEAPQLYVEYRFSSGFFLQTGRGYAPFGIAFQQRDLAMFRRRGGPQMMMANGNNNFVIAEPVWSGVHFSGSFRFENTTSGYDIYTLSPRTNPNTLGGGGRAWFEIATPITFGFSFQSGKHGPFTYDALGADLSIKYEKLGIDAEYAANLAGHSVGNSHSFYLEPYWILFGGKFLLYGALDYLDNSSPASLGPTLLAAAYQKWEYGGGINWLPYLNTRFRLGILMNDYVGGLNVAMATPDYCSFDLSAGVDF